MALCCYTEAFIVIPWLQVKVGVGLWGRLFNSGSLSCYTEAAIVIQRLLYNNGSSLLNSSLRSRSRLNLGQIHDLGRREL